jgi:hypothetical protein
MNCGAVNPCDPYCQVVLDTPPGLDAGAGFLSNEGGLQLAFPGTTPNLCNEPSNAGSTLANIFTNPAAYRNNVGGPNIPCSGGGTSGDTCPMDYYCHLGTCTPYSQGVTNPGCATLPDFTVGMGCWDNGANLNGLELEVCNRGGIVANSGNLVVDMADVAPQNTAAAGCAAQTWPDVLQNVSMPNAAYCTIPLGMKNIQPGECVSFNIFNPPAPITCNRGGQAGVGPALTTGNFPFGAGSQIAVDVNPPPGTAFSPSSTPLPECDVCNNYSTIDGNSAGHAYAACSQGFCGASGGSSGAACPASAITGTVMDPGLNVGLSNVAVYIPNPGQMPIVIPDEPNVAAGTGATPSCDSCASLYTPYGVTNYAVQTDVNGNFTLPVPPGTYTVISQIGRWRKIVHNVNVTGCTTTSLAPMAGSPQLSMPSCRIGGTCPANAQGDIPRTAIVEGQRESIECWLGQLGIATSEIKPYAPGNANRIDLYDTEVTGNEGLNYWNSTSAVQPPSSTTLWNNAANVNTLNNYSQVIQPCDGNGFNGTGTETASVLSYANAGGRLFLNHWSGNWLADGPWNTGAVANFTVGSTYVQAALLNSTPDQQAMYSWLSVWDQPGGVIPLANAFGRMSSVGADSVELSQNPDGTVSTMWFNTPITASAGSYCGRVVFNDLHVSQSRATNLHLGNTAATTFPMACVHGCPPTDTCPIVGGVQLGLTSSELELEYELFALAACNLGVSMPLPPPPPPPPPTPLVPTTFTRIFKASCQAGFTPKWGFFEWEATIPTGTSISFSVASAPDGMGGPGMFGALVPLAMATMSSAMYVASPSVDTILTSAVPAQTSQDYLEVAMTLTPNAAGDVSPTLLKWEQLYDCDP